MAVRLWAMRTATLAVVAVLCVCYVLRWTRGVGTCVAVRACVRVCSCAGGGYTKNKSKREFGVAQLLPKKVVAVRSIAPLHS